MTKLSIVLLAVVPACVTEGADRSSGLGSIDQAIVGGTTANAADYPTVVALENGPGQWFCTGTLIDPQWVLTAAHCVLAGEGSPAQTPAGLKIRFDDGNVNDTTGGKEVAVSEIHAPNFDFESWDNDIALVKLAAPVTDRQPTPIWRDATPFGTSVLEVGYGASSNNQSNDGAGVLRKVTKITADCGGAADAGISNANLICMNADDGKGSCFGDSGGPAFATFAGKTYVTGVTSGGNGDQCGQGWDLYTSIKAEIAWVDGVLGNTGTDPTDPADPGDPTDPTNPDDPGDPTSPTGTAGGMDAPIVGGCSAGGSSSGLGLALALVGLVGFRRRR